MVDVHLSSSYIVGYDVIYHQLERGVTVVVITHNLALTAMGDKVIKVKNGVVDSVTVNENPLPIEQIEW